MRAAYDEFDMVMRRRYVKRPPMHRDTKTGGYMRFGRRGSSSSISLSPSLDPTSVQLSGVAMPSPSSYNMSISMSTTGSKSSTFETSLLGRECDRDGVLDMEANVSESDSVSVWNPKDDTKRLMFGREYRYCKTSLPRAKASRLSFQEFLKDLRSPLTPL